MRLSLYTDLLPVSIYSYCRALLHIIAYLLRAGKPHTLSMIHSPLLCSLYILNQLDTLDDGSTNAKKIIYFLALGCVVNFCCRSFFFSFVLGNRGAFSTRSVVLLVYVYVSLFSHFIRYYCIESWHHQDH